MGVDIIDISWCHARLFQRHLHRPKSPVTFRMRCRYVIGVTRQAVAYDFSINLCTTRLCMFIFFQNHDARAFTHYKTVAVLVIWPTCGFWTVVIAHVQGTRLSEARNSERVDGAFRTASDHDVGIIIADHAGSIANGVRPRRTRGHDCVVRAF